MKKFRCTVTRVDEYEIEIDDSILNEKWMADFRDIFYGFYTYKEHAVQIAQMRARFNRSFIEGYGAPLINHEKPCFIDKEELNEAININILSEDDDCDVEVKEL